MREVVLLGDEAIAMGAIDAGITTAYGYPGTPSTEIMEYLLDFAKKNESALKASWCSNEKTALEAALGTSMVGKRVIVTMKHVGLNVALDPLMTAANLKICGGLVIAVADDPGMHSSQNEQDSRYLANFANIFCFEPATQQEAYDMTREAFDVSEKFHIPVILRIVTRLAHSRMSIRLDEKREKNKLVEKIDRSGWITLPANARRLFQERLDATKYYHQYSENSEYNYCTLNPDFTDYGVITTGIAKNYFDENLEDLLLRPSELHIGVYPIPEEMIKTFVLKFKKIVILEDGFPLVEKLLRGILPQNIEIIGKQNGFVPASGELNPDNVRKALGLTENRAPYKLQDDLTPRPPRLCTGCPHHDAFSALNKIREKYPKALVTSDIGCYSLGALPPLSSIDSIVCMGASIGMAIGAVEAGFYPVIATIGDGTFSHSGMAALTDAISKNSNITVIILDNYTVAMTGGQETILPSSKLEKVAIGLGVEKEHIRTINPLPKFLNENARIIEEEIEHEGISVILSPRICLRV